MGWRSLFISSPARLSVKLSQLVIKQEAEVTIPLEDIGAVVIETQQVTISAAALSAIADADIATFICDQKHLPCSIILPFQKHSRQWKIMKAQLAMSKPFAKQCWKRIVEQKITNQAYCLDYLQREGGDYLRTIVKDVKSGDTTNREAYAARVYFQSLLTTFRRKDDNVTTAAMNYGYAIFRGMIARILASYGFIPAMGIHHRNELNNFNLADDFIEVSRPLVDLWVASNVSPEATELSRNDRISLLSLLNHDMCINQNHQSVIRCMEEMVASFSTACHQNNVSCLKLPSLLPLSIHKYE
ncbi:CRISPR-associated endonuclease Cas1 [Sporomusa carbonis]|uniref:type II CRISPR-associated endonuclease Cas1 n=1 Tax=Sporomusa carbonis TaxID=3076075 RepID=UPI003A5D22F3